MKKTYIVELPITAVAYVEVTFEEEPTEDEIFCAACDKVSFDDVEEWECHEKIKEGNCFNGVLNAWSYELEL